MLAAMHIILNGRTINVASDSMTYADIVSLADTGRGDALHTVVWSTAKSGDAKRAGTLLPGDTLPLDEGMVITALVTDGA